MNCSLPGPSVHGILQARILEWVAACSSRDSSPPRESNLHLQHLLNCRRILYCWATREAQSLHCPIENTVQCVFISSMPATSSAHYFTIAHGILCANQIKFFVLSNNPPNAIYPVPFIADGVSRIIKSLVLFSRAIHCYLEFAYTERDRHKNAVDLSII